MLDLPEFEYMGLLAKYQESFIFFYTKTFRDCQQLALARHEVLEGSVLSV